MVLSAVAELDVTVLYCTTVAPFDRAGLRAMGEGEAVVVVEPGYPGALLPDVCAAYQDRAVRIVSVGLRQEVIHRYGTIEQLDAALGLTEEAVRQAIERALNVSSVA